MSFVARASASSGCAASRGHSPGVHLTKRRPGPFAAHIETVGAISDGLRRLGLEPVLVGGMALVLLGSRRVTRDFDFVIAQLDDRLEAVLELFHDKGLELVSRLDDEGEVVSTIDNRRVAAIRLRLDAPPSAFFYDWETRLRVDLMFDFPVPAAELARSAHKRKVRTRSFQIASEADLLRLKRMAQAERSFAGDAQDVAFLEARARRASTATRSGAGTRTSPPSGRPRSGPTRARRGSGTARRT